MFLASSAKPIDDSLRNLVEEIEAQNHHLSVLVACQLRYSLQQTTVEFTITEPRPFNVLEEFIIRAGIEFEPPPTVNELASILGLDTIFVQSTISNLQKLQTLAQKSPITVTEQGRLFYAKGAVPQPPYTVQIHAITDFLDEKLTFQTEPLNEVTLNLPDLASFLSIDNKIAEISSLNLEQIQTSLQASGVGLHEPEKSKIVTGFRVVSPNQNIWRKISIFIIFDAKEDKLSIQLRRGKQILDSRSKWLETLLSEGKVNLDKLCKLSNETLNLEQQAILNYKNDEIEARLGQIRQQALISPSKQKKSADSGTVIQLRDRLISQTVLEVINSANNQVIIYSPWLNHLFTNNELINSIEKLAKRGVWILIGHGISQEQAISSEILEKLQAIKTPEGLPSVQIVFLGNSHIKEVIVDRQIYLCGSCQWLSYSDYQIPLGELGYQVTIPQQVQEAHEFLSNRFQNHAQQLWKEAVKQRDTQLAIKPLCVWSALGMKETLFKEIEKTNWLELLPLGLEVMLQELRLNNLSADSITFKLALSLLSQVTGEEVFIDSLKQKYCQVIGVLATHNHETALNLLNNDIWSQFLRLRIAQEADSPEKFISQQTVTQQPKPRKGQAEKKARKKVKE